MQEALGNHEPAPRASISSRPWAEPLPAPAPASPCPCPGRAGWLGLAGDPATGMLGGDRDCPEALGDAPGRPGCILGKGPGHSPSWVTPLIHCPRTRLWLPNVPSRGWRTSQRVGTWL